MAPKRANSKVATSIDDTMKVDLLAKRKARLPLWTTSLRRHSMMRQSTAKGNTKTICLHQRAPHTPAALRGYLKHPHQTSSTQRQKTPSKIAKS
jgi:hypothetical protein